MRNLYLPWLACVFVSCSEYVEKKKTESFALAKTKVVENAISFERGIGVMIGGGLLNISCEVSGQVEKILVEVGEKVETGQILIVLGNRRLTLELEAARAVYEAARVGRLASIGRRDAALKKFERYQGIKNLVSQDEFAKLSSETDLANSDVRLAQAKENEMHARLRRARSRVEQLEIRSPISGEVALLYLGPGESVVEGAAAARILGEGQKKTRFAIRPGQKIKLDGHKKLWTEIEGEVLLLKLESISPEVDGPSGLVFAEASFLENTELAIPVGQRVGVFFY